MASQGISYLETWILPTLIYLQVFCSMSKQTFLCLDIDQFNGVMQLLESSLVDKIEKALKPCWLSPPRCHQRKRWCQYGPTWSIVQHWAALTWASAWSEQTSGGFERCPTHSQRNPKETLPGGGHFCNQKRETESWWSYRYLLLYSSLCSTLKQHHSIRYWQVRCSRWPWCGNPKKPEVPLMSHMVPEK